MTLLDVCENLGMQIENAIRLKILSNVPPPLKESTVKQKGSSVTLIDTGQMLASVSHQVDDSNPELITVSSGIFEENVAEYAVSHEYGREDANIPMRSFIRSTYDENFDKKALIPSMEEIQSNPRSRSAKLRVAERI